MRINSTGQPNPFFGMASAARQEPGSSLIVGDAARRELTGHLILASGDDVMAYTGEGVDPQQGHGSVEANLARDTVRRADELFRSWQIKEQTGQVTPLSSSRILQNITRTLVNSLERCRLENIPLTAVKPLVEKLLLPLNKAIQKQEKSLSRELAEKHTKFIDQTTLAFDDEETTTEQLSNLTTASVLCVKLARQLEISLNPAGD